MKTISDYTIFCTPAQTKKAFELGAPIRNFITKEAGKRLVDIAKLENRIEEYEKELIKYHNTIIGDMVYCIPTAEQMLGWLEEHHIDCFVGKQPTHRFVATVCVNEELIYSQPYPSRKEATLAAIDAALEYNNKNRICK